MAEEVIQNVENNQPSKGKKFLAAIKEWWRKRIVALKVKPQTIPLMVMVITTVYFMLILFKLSWAVERNTDTPASGICVFVTTLISLLYLVSFLNAFPKRKKPNIFFIVLVGVMIAIQLACDIAYYLQMKNAIDAAVFEEGVENVNHDAANAAQPFMLGHIILLGISAIVFALLPVYSRLIKKINTSIKVESATEHMGEKIDIEEEDD